MWGGCEEGVRKGECVRGECERGSVRGSVRRGRVMERVMGEV